MQSTCFSLGDVRVNLEFTKRPTLIKGSSSARRRPCAHILTMRDGDWRMLTLIRARSVSLARRRGLVGWSVVGRSAHAYANHIRRRVGFQEEMSTGQFHHAIDYYSIPRSLYMAQTGVNRPFNHPFYPFYLTRERRRLRGLN